MTIVDLCNEKLQKLKYSVMSMSFILVTAIELYYYIRGVSILDNIVDWFLGMAGAFVLIEITFRSASELQNQLQNEIIVRRKMEDKLKESEEKYRTTFEHTGTAMTVVEEDTIISLTNSEFAKLSGYKKEEIEGKLSWTEFVHPEDLERMKKYHYARRKGDRTPKQYEFRFINRHGVVKDILITIDVIPGTKKSVASLLDITHIRRLNKLLRAISEVNELVAKERTPEKILKSVCYNLSIAFDGVIAILGESIEDLKIVESNTGDSGRVDEIVKKCPAISKAMAGELTIIKMRDDLCKICDEKLCNMLSIPLEYNKHNGVISVKSSSEFTDEEIKLLEKLSKNISFALSAYEVEEREKTAVEQLVNNLFQFDSAADRLRNPLAIIMSSVELVGELGSKKTLEIIYEQAKRIKKELDELRREEIKTFQLTEESIQKN